MKLQKCCEALGITFEELAKETGLSIPTFYNINNGANTTMEVMTKIQKATEKITGIGLLAEQYLEIYK